MACGLPTPLPLSPGDERVIDEQRRLLAARLAANVRSSLRHRLRTLGGKRWEQAAAPTTIVFSPSDLFRIVFRARVPPVSLTAVETALAEKRRDPGSIPASLTAAPPTGSAPTHPVRVADGPGFIYVFRDRRDPPDVVKIGSTKSTNPADRVADWTRTLRHTTGERGVASDQIAMLFAFPTRARFTTESILHTLLRCFWVPDRFHAETGDHLVEYFRISDVLGLKLFVLGTTQYVDSVLAGTE